MCDVAGVCIAIIVSVISLSLVSSIPGLPYVKLGSLEGKGELWESLFGDVDVGGGAGDVSSHISPIDKLPIEEVALLVGLLCDKPGLVFDRVSPIVVA